MERESQPVYSRLIRDMGDKLPYTNFYRFCQLIEQSTPQHPLLGSTSSPKDDLIRFRPHPGMGFPVSEFKALQYDAQHPERPPTVRTTFLGLYGVDSPLPSSYVDDIAQQREGHDAVEEFLDIFNHRIMTQFYRIWRKYSYPASFEQGGTDETSKRLLGLIGLGIPGTAKNIATPVSRFLALLGNMRMPTRTAEGTIALVHLLSSETKATVRPHYPRSIAIKPLRFGDKTPLGLRPVLGNSAKEVNSMFELQLFTENPAVAQAWLPGGHLSEDLQILLRVYLGWRVDTRILLTLPRRILPPARLQTTADSGFRGQLGYTAVMRAVSESSQATLTPTITIRLCDYQGLKPNRKIREVTNVCF